MRKQIRSSLSLAILLTPLVPACLGSGGRPYEVVEGREGAGGKEGFEPPGMNTPDEDAVSPQPNPPIAPEPTKRANGAAPISGGTLTVLADGHTAVASDPDRDKIFVVDLEQRKLTTTISLSAGEEPGRSVEDADGRVHVVLRGSGSVATLAPSSHALLQRRAVCGAPRGIAYDKARDQVVVACVGGELVQLAANGNAVSKTMLDKDLRDVVVVGDRYLISQFKTASLLTFNPATKAVESRVEAPLSSAASRKQMFKTNDGPYEANMGAAGVAYRMVPLRGGGAVMLHQEASNGPLSTEGGGYSGDLCKGSTVGATLAMVTGADGKVAVKSSGHMMGLSLPVDVAVSASGKTFAFASAGSNPDPKAMMNPFGNRHVIVIARSAAEVPEACIFPPSPGSTMEPVLGGGGQGGMAGAGGSGGSAPDVEPPDIIAYRQPTGQTTAVAFDGKGRLIAQIREPAALEVLSGSDVINIALDTTSVADTGHSFFHMPVGISSLACASCHPEGGEDGRTWMFDTLGARRTQSLRGGLGDTGPFHWDGDMMDVSQIMTDVFSKRMGGPTLSTPQKQAVVSFVNSIKTIKPSPALDPAVVSRGEKLFNDPQVGCSTCHSGAHFTNNKTMDVGTKKAFQVPSLTGVAFRAPFMHDGCASTLSARFDKTCGGTNHGKVDHLTPAQLAELTAYLETL